MCTRWGDARAVSACCTRLKTAKESIAVRIAARAAAKARGMNVCRGPELQLIQTFRLERGSRARDKCWVPC
jgi:hypothetical protein